MRISLICIVCTAGLAVSQSPADRENNKLTRELAKYDIYFSTFGTFLDGKKMFAVEAHVKVTRKSLDGLKLLRPAQVDFVRIQAEISDLSLMEAFLKDVADVPGPSSCALKLADDVVRLIEQVKQVHRSVSAREKMPPELEYLSLDAQIWQMKLNKSAKPKAEK